MRKNGRPRIKSELSLYTPATLPPSLVSSYLLLNNESKKLFNKAFGCLWRDVFSVTGCISRSGAASLYWVIDRIREENKLTPTELVMLSYIYYASGNGVNILHSDAIYHSPILPGILPISKRQTLTRLSTTGFIIRHRRNPSAPFLTIGYSKYPVFIELSDKTIKMFRGMDADVYNILMKVSLNDLIVIGKREKQKAPANNDEGKSPELAP